MNIILDQFSHHSNYATISELLLIVMFILDEVVNQVSFLEFTTATYVSHKKHHILTGLSKTCVVHPFNCYWLVIFLLILHSSGNCILYWSYSTFLGSDHCTYFASVKLSKFYLLFNI